MKKCHGLLSLPLEVRPATSTTSYYSNGGSETSGSGSDSDNGGEGSNGGTSSSSSTSSSSGGGGGAGGNDGNGGPKIFQNGERIAGRVFSSIVVQAFAIVFAGLLTGFGLYRLVSSNS